MSQPSFARNEPQAASYLQRGMAGQEHLMNLNPHVYGNIDPHLTHPMHPAQPVPQAPPNPYVPDALNHEFSGDEGEQMHQSLQNQTPSLTASSTRSSSTAPSSEAGDIEQYTTTLGKRKRSKRKNDSLESKSRILGRFWNIFVFVQAALEEGNKYYGDPQISRNDLSTMQKFWLDYYGYLVEFLGEDFFEEEIDARGIAAFAEVITNGRNKSKTDDVYAIVENLGKLYPFKTELPDKILRGYNHDECARLLAPRKYDLNDQKVREDLRNFIRVPKYNDWPMFMYENYTCDSSNFKIGWCKSDLLIRVGIYIAIGPNKAKIGSNGRGGRKGNAAKHNICCVNAQFIAYCCVMLHYALSSQPHFYTSDPETGSQRDRFPYQKFYYAIIKMFSDFKSELEPVLPFWNERLFPNAASKVLINDNTPASPIHDEEPSDADLMQQQMLQERDERAQRPH
ncbi:hypothetical protein SCHPADRAFT_947381 [Schizopora paradoxa]|uniref:Uncharacterized protein n=1 Tax=Schizopora paradoxa TaxID=27342 RepID=A0A0H2R0S1_9AGAM|nr:hypothetical protein SCHPADRAFT_947381 [Schizopora paradoxa]